MLTIARLTYREVLSKRIFYIVLVLTVIFLIVYGVALQFTVDDIERHGAGFSLDRAVIYPQLMSLGLYFSTFVVALMAVFSTVNAISGEIETGTIQAVVTKPIKRSAFLLGKFLGYAVMMIAYSSFLYLAVLWITRFITGYAAPNIASGLFTFLLIPLLLLVLSLLGSSALSTMANGITVFMLYIIGMVGGMVEQIGAAMNNLALVNLGVLSSLIMPSDAMYRRMIYNLLTGGDNPLNVFSVSPFASNTPPSGIMIIYTLLYIPFMLIIALRIFNRRDI